jgi:hypothetical protein
MTGELVQVRMLQAVTYGDLPAWLPGSVRWVHPDLAAVMVKNGEAEYHTGLDTSVAVGAVVMRTR